MSTHVPSIGIPFPRHDKLLAMLSGRNRAQALDAVILAPTDVILSSGAAVVAVIEGGQAGSEITITDAGAILADLTDTGVAITEAVRRAFKRAARAQTLRIEGPQLRLGPVAIDDAVPALMLFADGARRVAEAIAEAARKSSREHFRERIRSELDRIFTAGNVHPDGPLEGKSARKHRFDYLITLPAGRQLALDVPAPDQSSIASVVLRQMDVHATQQPTLTQAITYDEQDEWSSSSLAQLQLANVPLIRSDRLEEVIWKIAGVDSRSR